MTTLYIVLHRQADTRPHARPENEGEFTGAATRLAEDTDIAVRYFRSGQQVLDIITEYDRIDRLVIFAHGAADGIGAIGLLGLHSSRRGNSFRNLDQLALVLLPRIVDGAIIGLAACTCGASPRGWRETTDVNARQVAARAGLYPNRPSVYPPIPPGTTRTSRGREIPMEDNARNRQRQWEAAWRSIPANRTLLNAVATDFNTFAINSRYTDTGIGSFAYLMRNVLAERNVSVRAHMWSGGATLNSSIIEFLPSSPSEGPSPGIIISANFVSESGYDQLTRRWRNEYTSIWQTAETGEQWIIGNLDAVHATGLPEDANSPQEANTLPLDTSSAVAPSSSIIPEQRREDASENGEEGSSDGQSTSASTTDVPRVLPADATRNTAAAAANATVANPIDPQERLDRNASNWGSALESQMNGR